MRNLQEWSYFPALAYGHIRSAGFAFESRVLALLNEAVFRQPSTIQSQVDQRLSDIVREIKDLIEKDSRNIAEGLYPWTVLLPESPIQHWMRYPRVILDSLHVGYRRKKGRTTDFAPHLKGQIKNLPRYYRRNFHFQTNGYLSKESAELYEHQVEILFAGSADAMRRLILSPLKTHFSHSDGEGLTFLELAAGTGRSTRFVKLAFPKAKIVIVDLSEAYLKAAQKRLSDLDGIDFVQADGANLPFREGTFDAAYSVFLFHELPHSERFKVLRESQRVLKGGGFLGLVDSIQKMDQPHLTSALEAFPKDFHEPYYRNYIQNPMSQYFEDLGLDWKQDEPGFFSKAIYART